MRSAIEIILKEDVQDIFDGFSSCFSIRIGFFSPTGEELAVGLRKPESEFCTLVRESLQKKDKCLTLDSEKWQEALQRKDMVTYHCFAGMIESIIPIFYENIHLGFFMMGQYRSEERKLNRSLLDEWEERFGSSEKLVLAYLKTPSITRNQIDSIQQFFRVIVNYIVSQNMITIKSNLIVERIINYAKTHIDENLSVEEAAALVGKSTSTVSHLFTSMLHKSFKQVIIELKIEKAEEYFRLGPNVTIRDVAGLVGYDDPYYFSRLYKKYRGHSPSGYIHSHRTSPPLQKIL